MKALSSTVVKVLKILVLIVVAIILVMLIYGGGFNNKTHEQNVEGKSERDEAIKTYTDIGYSKEEAEEIYENDFNEANEPMDIEEQLRLLGK